MRRRLKAKAARIISGSNFWGIECLASSPRKCCSRPTLPRRKENSRSACPTSCGAKRARTSRANGALRDIFVWAQAKLRPGEAKDPDPRRRLRSADWGGVSRWRLQRRHAISFVARSISACGRGAGHRRIRKPRCRNGRRRVVFLRPFTRRKSARAPITRRASRSASR